MASPSSPAPVSSAPARYRRADVVDRAIDLLEEVGLEGLSMRRLAGDLGVRPSALYHHVASKQELLGAVADEMLERGRRATEVLGWQDELRLACVELRDTMLRHRDGAAVLATARAQGVGGTDPVTRMAAVLAFNGADPELARVGAQTLFHFVFGHVADRQAAGVAGEPGDADFAVGLAIVLRGLETRVGTHGDDRSS
ncbi:TetR/AcrR family transcriptional regulator C-terminal domain-containing protein [Nocardioides jiangxiensis]|uniref:TetR/AcrR family transcriptional regulator C-terminal domain-containing protein n=1 Tax=Nocardioides jiangxiensis TaxID=3064524 RepID=A0ABT9B2R1_9ACTN|nr:TetR/AcrR family transcriptional regulator C-terminal domain-containing protein [Nocardioides sp. WY-20]MDO7869134.1 TetR/AcrR family transcriptional regulator C-terminal domain-containing protein [Nocardioides sp. WY-20]